MVQLLQAVVSKAPIFDISNDLDRSVLKGVVSQGDLLLVRGRHFFRKIKFHDSGPGQNSEVRRAVNGVEVSFLIDRWEAVANSSWGGWLLGTQNASSLVRVVAVENEGEKLLIKCTGVAIGGQMPGIETRSYFNPSCPIDRYGDQDFD